MSRLEELPAAAREVVDEHSILVTGRDPDLGDGVDRRVPVNTSG